MIASNPSKLTDYSQPQTTPYNIDYNCRRCQSPGATIRLLDDYSIPLQSIVRLCDDCYTEYRQWLYTVSDRERQYHRVAHGQSWEYNDYIAGMRVFNRFKRMFRA